MKTVWDFVEKNYPKYHGCSDIALADDLEKILDNEMSEGDSAYILLMEKYDGNVEDTRIRADRNSILVSIYEKSIQCFVDEIVVDTDKMRWIGIPVLKEHAEFARKEVRDIPHHDFTQQELGDDKYVIVKILVDEFVLEETKRLLLLIHQKIEFHFNQKF